MTDLSLPRMDHEKAKLSHARLFLSIKRENFKVRQAYIDMPLKEYATTFTSISISS